MARPVPYNIDAEESVLASLMLDYKIIMKVSSVLSASDFYREKHKWIYEALLALHERNEPADLVTVADELERRGRLGDCGGAVALSQLQLRLPTAIHVEYYAKIVKRHAVLRKAIHAAEQIAKMAYEYVDTELDGFLEKAEQLIFNLSNQGKKTSFVPIQEILGDLYEQVENMFMDGRTEGLETKFGSLDKPLGGLGRGKLYLLAARPSMGKTALALNITENVVLNGGTVLFFSVEMSNQDLAQRLIAKQTGISAVRLRSGPIYDEDLEKVALGIEQYREAKFFIDETPELSTTRMRSVARQVMGQAPLSLIVVDYLQLMNTGRRMDNRVQEIGIISRSLKGLARELNIPVLALSQLNRSLENRQDKRPQLSDLRASGSLEQDADVVMFIYREEVYDKDAPPVAEIMIAKHRQGPTGTVSLRFDKESASFSEFEELDEEELLDVYPEYTQGQLEDIIF